MDKTIMRCCSHLSVVTWWFTRLIVWQRSSRFFEFLSITVTLRNEFKVNLTMILKVPLSNRNSSITSC